MKPVLVLLAGASLIAAAPAKIVPAPADDRPAQPVGAAARAKLGPEPLAKPPEDVGSADDPAAQPELNAPASAAGGAAVPSNAAATRPLR